MNNFQGLQKCRLIAQYYAFLNITPILQFHLDKVQANPKSRDDNNKVNEFFSVFDIFRQFLWTGFVTLERFSN